MSGANAIDPCLYSQDISEKRWLDAIPLKAREIPEELLTHAKRDFKLQSLAMWASITNILGVHTRKTNGIRYGKTLFSKRVFDRQFQRCMPSAHVGHSLSIFAAMDGYHNPGMFGNLMADGFIKFAAGNVKRGIAGWLQADKGIKGVIITGNGIRNFGRARLDSAAVNGHHRNAGIPVSHLDRVIHPACLFFFQGGK
jgi:hypothetical protein